MRCLKLASSVAVSNCLLFLGGLGRLLEILGSRGTLAARFPHGFTETGLDPVPFLLDVDVQAFC